MAGSASNVSVVRINGVSVSATPTSGKVLTASGGTAASWSAAPSAPVASVAGKTGAVTLVKSDVGLANVDDKSDVNKPVSSATQTALNAKANTFHTHAIADTTGLQTALDGKASTAHTHTIANVTNLQTTLDSKVNAGDAALATKGGAEAVQTLTSTANTTLNLNNANVFDLTLGVTATTLQVSNATAGKACSFALYLRQGAGGRTVTWPAGTKWSGGAPTLSTAANAVDIVVLESIDGGNTWFGSLVGTNFI